MKNKDIRWIQRFNNYTKALSRLQNAVDLSKTRQLTELEKQGLVQAFEFTHELAWNLIKDYFKYQGSSEIYGSRDASREAYNKGLIKNGHIWMEMIVSRNKTSHTYNEETVGEITTAIINEYIFAFVELKNKMQELKTREENL